VRPAPHRTRRAGVAVAVVFRIPDPAVGAGLLRTVIAKRQIADEMGAVCVYTDSVSTVRFLVHADSGARTPKVVQYPIRRPVRRATAIVLCFQWQQAGPGAKLTTVYDGVVNTLTVRDCILRYANQSPITLFGSVRETIPFETLPAVVHEVRIYKSLLSDDELAATYTHLQQKWA
jgi:hypothetical protein